jgi:hypothetical protein
MEGMSSGGGLEIGISCITVPHLVTGGQKHTHSDSPQLAAANTIALIVIIAILYGPRPAPTKTN